MERAKSNGKPVILVLTEFGRRERNAADIALQLAKCIHADILLLNSDFTQGGDALNAALRFG